MTVALLRTENKAPKRQLAPTGNQVVPTPGNSLDKDDAIRLAAEKGLRSSRYWSVRNVRCSVEDGVVVLFGTVTSYYMKQIAQTVVMNLELVIRVENQCEVQYPSCGDGPMLGPRAWRGDDSVLDSSDSGKCFEGVVDRAADERASQT